MERYISKNMRSNKYMKISNEKGIALVMALVISAIALAIMAGLIYMITSGTQISGIQKRYETAKQAGIGGTDVVYQFIGARGNPNIPFFSVDIPAELVVVGASNCMNIKLNTPTFVGSTLNWPAACSNTLTINPMDTATYDVRFNIGTLPAYTVYAKIVDTVDGNSGGDSALVKGGVVSTGTGEVTVVSMPYLYTIELDAQDAANSAERAKLSVLYQY